MLGKEEDVEEESRSRSRLRVIVDKWASLLLEWEVANYGGLWERAMLRCEEEGTTVKQSHQLTNSLAHCQKLCLP